MPLKDKITGLLHRGNSDKNMNANTTTAAPLATTTAAPLQGRSYELPAEPVIATTAPLATTGAPLAHHNPLDRNHDGRVDLNDLRGNQSGLDRNHDGIDDRLQGGRRLSNGQMMGLDRNHDGIDDRLQTGLVGGIDRNHDGIDDRLQQGVYVQGQNRASLVRAEPTIIETIQKDVVVHERIHPVEKEEIQPIIYREREQLDVKQVTQMLHETQIQPTIVQQRELPAERREAIIERGAPIQENIILPTTQRDATLRTQQIHAPIVEETIKKTVIQEIQPVLERDVFVPTIVQNTQPIYEKIVEAPVVYRETREVRELGTQSYVAPAVVRETYVAPVVVREEPIYVQEPQVLQVVPITTTTTVETYDHKMNPIETRDFINNKGLPLR